jgi:hypothetical protein
MEDKCQPLDATFAQQRVSLYGLMSLQRTKVSGYFNALNAVLWELRI